jgi:hypothetical protein
VRPNAMHVSSYHSLGRLIGGAGAIAASCDLPFAVSLIVSSRGATEKLMPVECFSFDEKGKSAGE